MSPRDRFRLPSLRHGDVSVVQSARLGPGDRGRVLRAPEAIEILLDFAQEAERGDRLSLVSLFLAMGNDAGTGLDRTPTHALVGRLVDAVERGEIVFVRAEQVRARHTSAAAATETPPPPSPAPVAPRRPKRRLAFQLVVVERDSGRPVREAPFTVLTPDGASHRVSTDTSGRISIPELEPGTCEVASETDGAEIEDSFEVDHVSATPPLLGSTAGGAPPSTVARSAPHGPARVVAPETYRVRTGDTPETIAAQHGMPWSAIARFNWNTTDPDELEQRYRARLGCKRRTPDGERFLFDDRDDPGIVLIPRPWQASLDVGPVHWIAVSPLRAIYISLENEAGLALPAAEYRLELADGSARRGRLGRSGVARLTGIPDGPFLVSYPDSVDLLARSLAASVRKAFDQQIAGPLLHLLMQSQEVVDRAIAIYDEYFNDLTGKGLAADVDQVVTDPEARRPLLALASLAGLSIEGGAGVVVALGESDESDGAGSARLDLVDQPKGLA